MAVGAVVLAPERSSRLAGLSGERLDGLEAVVQAHGERERIQICRENSRKRLTDASPFFVASDAAGQAAHR